MGPKAKGAPKGKAEEEKDDALQAVVLGDTFESAFAPFTDNRPRCLLPLVGTPLIEYTLEFLSNAGVQEVFLDGGPHIDQIEAYISTSRWKSSASPFKKLEFLKSGATSVGDVMRDLDQKQVFTRDFLVVSGDVVSNAFIEGALKAHRARRVKDKKAIMTMMLRETTTRDRTLVDSGLPTFVIDPTKNRCLNYAEKVPSGQYPHIAIDADLLATPEIDVRQDLIDCRIDICTPELLSLWTERFDDQTQRTQFLHGLLKDKVDGESIHNYSIHTHIISDRYSARVEDQPSYRKISYDILARLTFPLCLDNNIFPGQAYIRSKTGIYQEGQPTLAKNCRLERGTAIGRDTSIGASTVVRKSVIGRRCQIGKNVQISNAYIWDDVTIGNDVKILGAIIGNEAFVGDRCVIGTGASVSFGQKLTAGTILSGATNSTSTEDDLTDVEFDDLSSVSSDASEAANSTTGNTVGTRTESFATTMSDEDSGTNDRFHHETVSTLFDHMQANKAEQDVWIDLVSIWKSSNASDHQVRRAVAVAMMKHIQHQIDAGAASAKEASQATLSKYRKMVKQQEQTLDTVADQVDFLQQVQRDLVHRSSWKEILPYVAKDLYELDIFEEEVFLQWWEDERSTADDDMKRVRESALPFINFLKTADSESESESESEEESGDDE